MAITATGLLVTGAAAYGGGEAFELVKDIATARPKRALDRATKLAITGGLAKAATTTAAPVGTRTSFRESRYR